MGNGFFQFTDSNNHVVMRGGGSAGHFTYELASEVQCDGTLSVNEVEEVLPVVYPNPSYGWVHLNLGKGQWQVQVYDIIGRKVIEKQVDAKAALDFTKQPKGIYLLKARNDAEEFNTKIVIR